MNRITESKLEEFVITLFERQGYQYLYGPDISPNGNHPERASFTDVILIKRLEKVMTRINPNVSNEIIALALKEIQRSHSNELLENNMHFHRMLTEGIKIETQKKGTTRGEIVKLIDFDEMDTNEFLVVNQFTIIENNQNKRPDILLFVNGLPLVVIELKNPIDEKATIKSAYQQIETYKKLISGLFRSNAFIVISDGLEAKAGTISSGLSRFMTWRTSDGKTQASHLVSQLETLIVGMLKREILLDLVCNFIVFETLKTEDPETKLISIAPVKKMAAYHQYYAVNAAVSSTLRAANLSCDIDQSVFNTHGLNNVNKQPKGDKKAGVVWHTQGSGKSLSMVFYCGKIVHAMNNPTILVITDRNDLDEQLFETFSSATQLLRQEPKQASNRDNLKTLLQVASGGVIFSTIQKFQPETGNVFETLSIRHNIVVIADEAHRSQYGLTASTVDVKDTHGELIGNKTVYGFAKYLRDALPNATYLGFTGTPIEKTDVNTPAVFGNYVDIYDIAQAVEDGATVRIYYESRLAKVKLSDEGKRLVGELDEELAVMNLDDKQQNTAKLVQLEALIGSPSRITNIANDIVQHFEARQAVFTGKGMIVSMSRRIAVDLYNEIIKLRPTWHSDELSKGKIKVVMTAASSDGEALAKHHTTKTGRKTLADRMKNADDPLELVIVRDMWLTGFDAPSLHTLYIDKPMKGHTLMQAIARVNRVYKDKPGGLVVDYLGIAADLKQALSFYSDSGGKGDPTLLQEQAVEIMLEKLEVVENLYHGFAYQQYFNADVSQKLSIILAAEEHILGIEDGKKRYINEISALSQAFAIAVPHEAAIAVMDTVGFFQAVRARLLKFEIAENDMNDESLETTIKQVIDKALVSDSVVDIFDAAGLKKPDISVLSDEFLMELKNHEHKNVALEVLKKILNNEIKSRSKKNLVQSKSLMEMLETTIKKYQNKVLTAAEVMDELIKISKEIVSSDNLATQMGLSEFEFAFYSAVANHDNAKELMEHETLRALAVELTRLVRENTSIDWTIKENVKAKLKVLIKRTLRKYGYPPDMSLLATETVLRQAELLSNDLLM